MTTTTNVAQVKLNIMTQNQYDAATKSPTELYAITDAEIIPSQTGNNGKFLTTNGTAASWANLPVSDVTVNGTSVVSSGTASIANMQTTTNLVTSVDSSSTDTQYPSAKLFYDTCGDIETLINAL